jgi:Zn-dependent M16 (insulinase) family peptidase
MSAIAPMVHGGDPVELLDLEPVLASLREKIKDPDYVPGLIRRKLLDNPHRVTLTLRPDEKLEGHHQQAIREALARRKASLTEDEVTAIVERAQALEQRQLRKDDDSILPKVGLDDVPLQMPEPEGSYDAALGATVYSRGTNGLVYQQVVVPVPALSEQELLLLPYYTTLISEVGCGDLDYLQMQDRISAESGGIGASFSAKGRIDDVQDVSGYLIFSGKALARNSKALTNLLKDVYTGVRFDEQERIREIIAQVRARREQAVTGSGHALAMGAAAQGLSAGSWLTFRLGGLAGIRGTKELDKSLKDDKALAEFCASLTALHGKIRNQHRQFLLIGEDGQLAPMLDDLKSCWQGDAGQAGDAWAMAPVSYSTREAWLTSTQVNFCAKAYSTVAVDHPDAAALTVLGGFLRNGYLHRAIREKGGAYGGGAGQDSVNGVFRFFSYRDPRLADTLDDFDGALNWLRTENHDAQALEEAILGVIGQLDRPRSPAGAARHAFHNKLFGRTPEQRARFRERVLAVTLGELQRVADTWLVPENASVAVVTNPDNRAVVEGLGMAIQEL